MPTALALLFLGLIYLGAGGVCYLLYYDHWGYALALTFIVSFFDRHNFLVSAGWVVFAIYKIFW